MKAQEFSSPPEELAVALGKLAALRPQIVALFAPPGSIADEKAFAAACAGLQGTHVIGCTAGGGFSGSAVNDGMINGLALRFDRATVKAASAPVPSPDDSYNAGQVLARAVAGPDLRGIFLLAPAGKVNGTLLAAGVSESAGKDTALSGGLAADSAGAARVFFGGKALDGHAAAFAIHGAASVKSALRCGWRPFGPARRVTRAAGCVLYQIDGKPALQAYRDYLGDEEKNIASDALLFPLSVLREEDRSGTGLVRCPVAVDETEGSVILAGDLPQGALVRFMHATGSDLAAAAAEAGAACADSGPGAALLVSCAGRRLVLGGDVADEIEAAQGSLGAPAPAAGFYGLGQFGAPAGSPDVTNQSIAIFRMAEAA